ncbi:hypothetical protein G8764_12135 [Pseudomaricurvus alcaniphilus]|uniref:hypothetical protein n=1 Tax=Pseudomaricurvus alcaniphilus TaxID=1166482 RepID=UPI0014087815|nr:hypothetical protein [Pseudomaricurvus alcaniphilus]NHN38049.1 hypothetical protein [Pseudomaricurvus alcaniphilus]
MYGVLSYKQIVEIVKQRFENRDYHAPKSQNAADQPTLVRMVGLLFTRPDSNLAQQEIIPGLDYFHVRSGNHIDFPGATT